MASGEHEHQADTPAAVPAAAARAEARPRPRPFLVLAADGRAHGDGGEVLELPRPLAEITNAGELAALALELHTRRLYVPRPVRELLGLPGEIPLTESVQGDIRTSWPGGRTRHHHVEADPVAPGRVARGLPGAARAARGRIARLSRVAA